MQNIYKKIQEKTELFDKIEDSLINNSNIALFGAGYFGISAYDYLKKQGHKIKFFLDNSEEKHGKFIDGVEILKFDENLLNNLDAVIITPKDFDIIFDIKKQLKGKVNFITFDEFFIVKHIKKYAQIKETVFKDTQSKECLDNLLLAMMTQQSRYCEDAYTQNQYFCLPKFSNTMNEIFVDAGAYVGDTLERFIWAQGGCFRKIYSFEPGKNQFRAMVERKKRLVSEWALDNESIELINSGVSENSGDAVINVNNNNILQSLRIDEFSKSQTEESKITICKLDEYLENTPVTFIKADIEGMELLMLKGAKQVISENLPKIAICVYHKNNDLFEIIEYLKELIPQYNFAIRHHSPTLMETVLYAWV